MKYRCFASCSFGLESMTALELKKLQFEDVKASDARVYFNADEEGIARANIFLRTADRVYIELSDFNATTFDELFEGVKQVPFEKYIPKDGCFPVDGDAVKSKLFSVSDIQSISKKAIVDRLMSKHRTKMLPETGKRYNVHIKMLRDKVSVCINTSGMGLNRRGYRKGNVKAPIRETLAAGIVMISGWRGGPLADPMCGSGTVAIEAAMIGAGIAPGINRSFDAQSWNDFGRAFDTAKEQARQNRTQPCEIYASDIDTKALRSADTNAKAAGVKIKLYHADVADFKRNDCTIITNPPYAQRLGQKNQVHELYRSMGKAMSENKRKFIITADNEFERWFGKRADKKRKLYNGNIRCTFFQYFR